MPASQAGPEQAEIDPAAAEDPDRLAGGVGEQAPEQVLAVDQGPMSATAGPPGDLDGFPATLVERELGRRAGEGDTQRVDVWAEATALISTMRSSGLG